MWERCEAGLPTQSPSVIPTLQPSVAPDVSSCTHDQMYEMTFQSSYPCNIYPKLFCCTQTKVFGNGGILNNEISYFARCSTGTHLNMLNSTVNPSFQGCTQVGSKCQIGKARVGSRFFGRVVFEVIKICRFRSGQNVRSGRVG